MSETLGTATLDLSTDNTGLNKGMDSAESTTKSKMGKIGSLVGKGSKVAAAGFAAAGAAAVGAATKIASTGDQVAESASQAGMGAQEYQELSFALDEVGVNAPDTSLQKFNRRVGEAADGGGAAKDSLEALGVAVKDASGNVRDTNEVMDESVKRLAQIDDDSRRAALAGDLFGKKAGPQLAASLSEGTASIDDARQKANELGITMGEDAIESSQKLMGGIDDLKNSLIGAFRTAFTPFVTFLADHAVPVIQNAIVPAIQKFANVIGGLFALVLQGDFQKGLGAALGIHEDSPLVSGLLTLREGIAGVMDNITDLWDTFQEGEGFVDGLMDVFDSLADQIGSGEFFKPLMESAQDLFSDLVDWLSDDGISTILETIMEARARMLDAAMQLFTSMLEAATDFLPDLMSFITGTMIPNILDFIVRSVPDLLDAALTLFEALLDAITTVLPELLDQLANNVLPSVLDAIIKMIPQVLDAAIKVFVQLIEAVAEILPQLVNTLLGEVLPTLITTLLEMLPQILDAGIKIFTALVDAVIQILPTLIDVIITDVIPAVVTALINNMPQILNASMRLFGALASGLARMIPEIISQLARSLMPGIVNTITSIDMVAIGKSLIRSLGRGIAALGSWLRRKVGSIIESAIPDVISDRLNMGSPSKLLIKMGKEAMEGLEIGIEQGMPRIEDKIGRIAPMLQGAIGINQASNGGMGGETNITINNPQPEATEDNIVRVERRRQLMGAG